MKKFILMMIAALGIATGAQAAGDGGLAWDKAPARTNDLGALQNGAKIFVNYCLNCHSAAYVRYNRLTDIGLTEAQIKDNLLFAGDRVGGTMKASIDPKQAKLWFGGNPPDLSLVARSRSVFGKGTGSDYLYTFLRSFYRDETKVSGWNNLALPNVGMPHVLWELQGERRPLLEAKGSGQEAQLKGWEQVSPGLMTPLQYDQAMGDLVAYMQWMSEPTHNRRVQIGVWVVLLLGLFVFIAWRLNAAYWKHVK